MKSAGVNISGLSTLFVLFGNFLSITALNSSRTNDDNTNLCLLNICSIILFICWLGNKSIDINTLVSIIILMLFYRSFFANFFHQSGHVICRTKARLFGRARKIPLCLLCNVFLTFLTISLSYFYIFA